MKALVGAFYKEGASVNIDVHRCHNWKSLSSSSDCTSQEATADGVRLLASARPGLPSLPWPASSSCQCSLVVTAGRTLKLGPPSPTQPAVATEKKQLFQIKSSCSLRLSSVINQHVY